MAESGSGQEKTEQPTAKKLQDARKEGQIPRSRELNTLVMLLVSGVGFLFMGKDIVSELMIILKQYFALERSLIFNDTLIAYQFWQALNIAILALLPFFILMVFAAVFGPLVLGGWSFSGKALMPKISKLDPIKGMSRVLSWKGIMELLKALLKFLLVATVGVLLLRYYLGDFFVLGDMSLNDALSKMASQLLWVFLLLSSSLILVAIIDVPFQLWDYNKQQKMTRQEVKDELKDTEGSPELRNKIKSKQYEIAQRRMMEAVPSADVVITNPTHFAVALKYDQLNMAAPIVVALGADIVALQIRKVASANNVQILESPALARSLFYNTKLGQEIPTGLYQAVAQVLAYVYQLKQYQSHGGEQPSPINDLPIPDDLRRDE